MRAFVLVWATLQLTYVTLLGILIILVVYLRSQVAALRREVSRLRGLFQGDPANSVNIR
jgi:hypothetical protein